MLIETLLCQSSFLCISPRSSVGRNRDSAHPECEAALVGGCDDDLDRKNSTLFKNVGAGDDASVKKTSSFKVFLFIILHISTDPTLTSGPCKVAIAAHSTRPAHGKTLPTPSILASQNGPIEPVSCLGQCQSTMSGYFGGNET